MSRPARPTRVCGARARAALAALLPVAGVAGTADAQRPIPELRLDATAAPGVGAQAGGGLFLPAGPYLRVGLVGGAGAHRRPAGQTPEGSARAGTAARLEALARFHLDPLRQARRALYVAGGVGHAWGAATDPRWRLVALVGVESALGRRRLGLEAGVGGGVRIGVVMRAR